MAPRTRMTPEQVAASVEMRRVEWEKKTGIKLLRKDPKEVMRETRAALSAGVAALARPGVRR